LAEDKLLTMNDLGNVLVDPGNSVIDASNSIVHISHPIVDGYHRIRNSPHSLVNGMRRLQVLCNRHSSFFLSQIVQLLQCIFQISFSD
jgi:hypothetical protein